MKKSLKRSVLVIAVGMMFAIGISVFSNNIISLRIETKAEEKSDLIELSNGETEIFVDKQQPYEIEIDNEKKIVWLTDDGKSYIKKGEKFDTITELNEAFHPQIEGTYTYRSVKEGHKFRYFSLDNGSIINDEYQGLKEVGNTYTIYASFKKEENFSIYCQKGKIGDQELYYEAITRKYNDEIFLPEEEKTGYIFDGWYVKDCDENKRFEGTSFSIGNKFNKSNMPDLSQGIEEDGVLIKLEPRFLITITYEPYGGYLTSLTSEIKIGSEQELLIPEKEGYEFNGWYFDTTGSNGTGAQCTDSTGKMIEKWNKTENTKLYAKWVGKKYKITYTLNAGTNSSENPTEYTAGEEVVLEDATRDGYKFMGWYHDGIRIYKIDQQVIGDIRLEAKWEKFYTLTFTAKNLKTDYSLINGEYEAIKGIKGEEVILPSVNFDGFILKLNGTYYAQGSLYTISQNATFELVEKNRGQLYNSSTGFYDIWTYNQFNTIIRNYPRYKYSIKANITQPENTNWNPISNFSGTLEGNGLCFKNLTIKYGLSDSGGTVTGEFYGLFGQNSGIIKNFKILQGSLVFYTYTATYTANQLYCGFITGKNTGTISSCNVLGTFFQFACIAPEITSNVGVICGYNEGRVEKCEVFEAAAQLTTGRGGGIVGWNVNGIITECEIGLSNVTCYQEFESENSQNYSSEHFAYIGGIVGHTEGGSITSCRVASNVNVSYNGYSSLSRSLAPEIGIIIGRNSGNVTYNGNKADGKTNVGSLQTVTWKGGFLNLKKYSHNQAKYVGGEVGRTL